MKTDIVKACALQAIKESPLLRSLSDDGPSTTLDKLDKLLAAAKDGDKPCNLITKGSILA
jgi:hypothetical protein